MQKHLTCWECASTSLHLGRWRPCHDNYPAILCDECDSVTLIDLRVVKYSNQHVFEFFIVPVRMEFAEHAFKHLCNDGCDHNQRQIPLTPMEPQEIGTLERFEESGNVPSFCFKRMRWNFARDFCVQLNGYQNQVSAAIIKK